MANKQLKTEDSSECLKDYEKIYHRNFYDVILTGESINEFKTIYDRIDEIERCVNVKNPLMALPIKSKSSKNIKLKIRVNNYDDFEKMLQIWPVDAFKNGVSVKPVEYKKELLIIVDGVKKSLKMNSLEIIELGNNYSLSKIKRIYNHKNKPTKKLIAKCHSIKDYVQVLNYGIKMNSGKMIVMPKIINPKVCLKCGDLNHQEKNCYQKEVCLKCLGSSHRMKLVYLIQKSVLIALVNTNVLVINILFGENLISSKYEILNEGHEPKERQASNYFKRLESGDFRKNDLKSYMLEKIIKSILQKTFGQINTRIEKFEESNKITVLKTTKIENLLNDLTQEIGASLQTRLLSSHIDELKVKNSVDNDEIRQLLSRIFSSVKILEPNA
ncbi:unnamed protein product [Brachionus calyciflorus]|uniref:Uncharacterized protein n=1 Tax=Brachionus calyciflorus TaxID=104777 RepID=A0A813MET4_9BILA|nr:unnamed protein product [Brachionus calyciflorus]